MTIPAESLETVLQEARSVRWESLPGAYGASDASDHSRDVPGMLQTLATEEEVDSAAWGDAYDDCFLAHVWHQYTIYPVTPVALGFLVRVASLRTNAAGAPTQQIALGLRLVAEATAAFRKQAELAQRELGEAAARAFSAHRGFLCAWLDTPLEAHALAIAGFVPEALTSSP